MTNFELIKCLSLEGLAGWLDSLEYSGDSPWNLWFDNNYCNKCPRATCPSDVSKAVLGIDSYFGSGVECAYCEMYDKCRYFPDLDATPTQEEVITMWLRRDINDD